MAGPYLHTMNFHGISFNEDWVRSMDEDEFVGSSLNDNHWKDPANRCDEPTRKARLGELWRLLNPKKVTHANDQQSAAGLLKSGSAFPGGELADRNGDGIHGPATGANVLGDIVGREGNTADRREVQRLFTQDDSREAEKGTTY